MISHPLDLEVKSEIKNYRGREREIISLLQEIEEKEVFKLFGYKSMFQYCVAELKLATYEAYQFIGVSQKCAAIPELQTAIFDETITAATARRLLPVIEKTNCAEWIEKAKLLPQKDLERQVARANPDKAIPEVLKPVSETWSQFGCGMDEETELILRRCREIATQKLGKSCQWGDVLKAIGRDFLKHQDPVEKADRNALKPVAAAPRVRPAVVTAKAAIAKQTKSLPTMLRHRVNLRDRGRCQHKLANGQKCLSAYWTEIHHRVLRSEGGPDALENLVTLCSFHHSHAHDGERSAWKKTASQGVAQSAEPTAFTAR